MNHGVVDIFAFQEALFVEALFGIALLGMIWAGFRRWLQHKEKTDGLIAEHAAQMERVETRLAALEQTLPDAPAPQRISTDEAAHPSP